jgi:hypothetical protein
MWKQNICQNKLKTYTNKAYKNKTVESTQLADLLGTTVETPVEQRCFKSRFHITYVYISWRVNGQFHCSN